MLTAASHKVDALKAHNVPWASVFVEDVRCDGFGTLQTLQRAYHTAAWHVLEMSNACVKVRRTPHDTTAIGLDRFVADVCRLL
jgi:hypothetical protein